MKNDGLLIQCQNCYTELEPENIHYAYGYVLCVECLCKLGESVKEQNNQGIKWDEERTYREDN